MAPDGPELLINQTCRNIEMIVVAARLPVVDFSTGQRRRA
jgi:hypothetical protein